MITGKSLGYLTAFFNSKLFRFCFKDYFPELLGDSRELRKVFFETMFVKPSIDDDWFAERVSVIQENKFKAFSTTKLENDVEERLWAYYELSVKERDMITGFS